MKDALTPLPSIMRKDMGPLSAIRKDQFTAKISKEAKETMQECLTEFILFNTSEAWELCEQSERKTILGSDLIFAMERLDFAYYGDILNKLL
jgi:histone H3/H4